MLTFSKNKKTENDESPLSKFSPGYARDLGRDESKQTITSGKDSESLNASRRKQNKSILGDA